MNNGIQTQTSKSDFSVSVEFLAIIVLRAAFNPSTELNSKGAMFSDLGNVRI